MNWRMQCRVSSACPSPCTHKQQSDHLRGLAENVPVLFVSGTEDNMCDRVRMVRELQTYIVSVCMCVKLLFILKLYLYILKYSILYPLMFYIRIFVYLIYSVYLFLSLSHSVYSLYILDY